MAKVSHFIQLTKPRLSSLVVLTCGTGIAIAPGAHPFWNVLFIILGTIGIVGAANALNCVIEKDVDAFMERTRTRPTVTGHVSSLEGTVFSLFVASLSLIILSIAANPLTAWLGFLGYVLYTLVYTPLKRYSYTSLFAGAIPGALPPLMGWVSITNSIDSVGVILFLILFFWQLPHFTAISMFRVEDYNRAGLKTIPGHFGLAKAQHHLIFYTLLMILVALLPVFFGFAGPYYLGGALALSLGFFALSLAGFLGWKKLNWSRAVFWGSLAYLPIILGIWILDHKIF